MKPLNIVIVTEVIYPRIAPRSFRATELAKDLSKKGHRVTLIASLGKYNYTDFEEKYQIEVKNLGVSRFSTKNSDGKIHLPLWKKGVIFFLHKLLDFPDICLCSKVKRAILNEPKFDMLITIAVPHPVHWGAAMIDDKNKNFKIWISDCGDPYMGNSFAKPLFYFKYMEKKWCKKTDYITVPIKEARLSYYKEFKDKIHVIPQGFDFSETQLEKYNKNSIPTFMYTGFFYSKKRDPSEFLKYISNLKVDFRFIVYTSNDSILRPFYSKLKEKLIVKKPVDREKLFAEMSKADFLLNIKNEGVGTQVPSKLIDYHLSRRPILEISSAFNENEEKIFLEFLSGEYEHKKVIYNIEQYDIQNVSNQFLNLF